MHNAPSVVFPLGRSNFQGLILLILWLSGLTAIALWWRVAPAPDWRLWAAASVLLTAAGAMALGWKNSPVGQLRWDGQGWRWESLGYQSGTLVSSLAVTLDFQAVMLLRLENHDGAILWLWARRSSMPERWLDLRRAVYSQNQRAPAALLSSEAAQRPAQPDVPSPYP
jgi:toxin CptA